MDYMRLKDTVNDLENQVLRSEMRRHELELKFEQLMREREQCEEQSASQATKHRNDRQNEQRRHQRNDVPAAAADGKPLHQHPGPAYKHHHHGRPQSNQIEWSTSSRNRNLMRMLDRIDVEAASLAARTEKLKLVKHHQELNLMKKWHARHLHRDSTLIAHLPTDGPTQLEPVKATTDGGKRFRAAVPYNTEPGVLLRPTLQSVQQQHFADDVVALQHVPVMHSSGGRSVPAVTLPASGEISGAAKTDFIKYLNELNQFPDTYDRNDVITDRLDIRPTMGAHPPLTQDELHSHYAPTRNYTTSATDKLHHPPSSQTIHNNHNNNISLGAAIKSSSRDHNLIVAGDTATSAEHLHFAQVAQPQPMFTVFAPPPRQPYITYGGKRWVLDDTPQIHHVRPPNIESNYSDHNAPYCSRTHVDDNVLVAPILSNVNASQYLPPMSSFTPSRVDPAADNASLYAAWLEARWAKKAAEEAEADVLRISEKRHPLSAHDDYPDDAYFTGATRRTQLSQPIPGSRPGFMSRPYIDLRGSSAVAHQRRPPDEAVNLNTISDNNTDKPPPPTHATTESYANHTRDGSGGGGGGVGIGAGPFASTSHVPNAADDQVVSISNTSSPGDPSHDVTNATAINSNESDAIKAIRHDATPDRLAHAEKIVVATEPEMMNATPAAADATPNVCTSPSTQKTNDVPLPTGESSSGMADIPTTTSNTSPSVTSPATAAVHRPTGNEAYVNHVTAIRPTSIYDGTDAAPDVGRANDETQSGPNSSSAPKRSNDAPAPAAPAPKQLTDIEESLYGEKITAMEYPLERRVTGDTTAVIDAGDHHPPDGALNTVHGGLVEHEQQQQHDVSADPTNGINNNNHHHHNTTNGGGEGVAEHIVAISPKNEDGGTMVGGQVGGDYDGQSETIRSESEVTAAAHEGETDGALQQYPSEYQYPTEVGEVDQQYDNPVPDQYPVDETSNQYQEQAPMDSNIAYDAAGNPIPDPSTAFDEAGNPMQDPNQYYDEQTGAYTMPTEYAQPTDGNSEYAQYQQDYEAQPGSEYNADEQQYDPNTAYVDPSQTQTDQYYGQQDPQTGDPYYGEHQQPGEQYYAEETAAYEGSQPVDNAQYSEYENGQPDAAATEYYATSENTISSSNDDQSQLGQNYTDATSVVADAANPTDYVASEADDSSVVQSDVQPDGGGNAGVGDRSESDFDFSAN